MILSYGETIWAGSDPSPVCTGEEKTKELRRSVDALGGLLVSEAVANGWK